MKKEEGKEVILKFAFKKDDLKKLKMPTDIVTKLTPMREIAKKALDDETYGGPVIGENIIIGHEDYSLIVAACSKNNVIKYMKHLCINGGLEKQIKGITEAFNGKAKGDVDRASKLFDAASDFHDFLNDYGTKMVIRGVSIDREMAELFPNIVSDEVIEFLNEESEQEDEDEIVIYVLQSGKKHVEATREDGREWLKKLDTFIENEEEAEDLLFDE